MQTFTEDVRKAIHTASDLLRSKPANLLSDEARVQQRKQCLTDIHRLINQWQAHEQYSKNTSIILSLCARGLIINELLDDKTKPYLDLQPIFEILIPRLHDPIDILKCHLYNLRSTAALTANKIYVLFKDERKNALVKAASRLEDTNPLVAAALRIYAAQLYYKNEQYDVAQSLLISAAAFYNKNPKLQELLAYKEMCANSLIELFEKKEIPELLIHAAKIYLSLSYLPSDSAQKALSCANALMQLFDQNKEPSLLILAAQLYIQTPITIALPLPATACTVSMLQLFNEKKDPKPLELALDLFSRVSRSDIPPSDILLQEAERCAVSLLDLFNKNREKTSFLHDAARLYTHLLKNTAHRQGAEACAHALLQLIPEVEEIDAFDDTREYESHLLEAARLYAILPLSQNALSDSETCIYLLKEIASHTSALSPESCAIEADRLTEHVAEERERLEEQEKQMTLAAQNTIASMYAARTESLREASYRIMSSYPFTILFKPARPAPRPTDEQVGAMISPIR